MAVERTDESRFVGTSDRVGLVSGEPAVIIRKQMVVALTKAVASGMDRRGQDSSHIYEVEAARTW